MYLRIAYQRPFAALLGTHQIPRVSYSDCYLFSLENRSKLLLPTNARPAFHRTLKPPFIVTMIAFRRHPRPTTSAPRLQPIKINPPRTYLPPLTARTLGVP